MTGGNLKQTVSEYVAFEHLNTDQTTLWSLLLMSGYLRGANTEAQGLLLKVDLSIPNQEVLAFYQYVIMAWLSAYRGSDWYDQFI